MDLSDYQIVNVIKTYAKSMRNKVRHGASGTEESGMHGETPSLDEAMRRMVFDRIENIVSGKINKT